MTHSFPSSLQPDTLREHLRALCRDIGPRPACSPAERRAADYVRTTLRRLGVNDVHEQSFKSYTTFGWVIIPLIPASLLAVLLAWSGWLWGKWLGGVILLIGAYVLYDFFYMQPPFFHRLIARHCSQNVIAHIPAKTATPRRTIYLIGHLDSQKQRFLVPTPNPAHMRWMTTSLLLVMVIGGLVFLGDIWLTARGIGWGVWIVGALILIESMISLALTGHDEKQPYVEGANDNASAVSVLLGIAAALQAQPLTNNEVRLLFTGCEEVQCVGLEAYRRQFKPPHENTYWIDLEMVGTGGICYVTRHGISYLTTYTPHAEMVQLAEQTAQQYPELQVEGRPLLIVEETATLRLNDYRAICLAGYDTQGYLPNWHRLTDTLENIEPETLSRAACFTWALLQTIDQAK